MNQIGARIFLRLYGDSEREVAQLTDDEVWVRALFLSYDGGSVPESPPSRRYAVTVMICLAVTLAGIAAVIAVGWVIAKWRH